MNRIIDVIHPDDEMFLYFLKKGHENKKAISLYMDSGKAMLQDFLSIVSPLNIAIDNASILEFACGYGRFTRHLLGIVDSSQVTVADIYTKAVDFQKNQFGVKGFYSASEPDDILIPDLYDIVFVGSLFSHLPYSIWGKMLVKLYQSLKSGGALIFSVHGPGCMSRDAAMPPSGFLYMPSSESRTLAKDIYGTTYVTIDFVNKQVYELTNRPVHAFRTKGLYNYQDVYVVLNRNVEVDSIRYSVDLFKSGFVHGWALFKPNPSFKLPIQILSDGVVVASGSASEFRKDLAQASIGDGSCSFKLPLVGHVKPNAPLVLRIFDHEYDVPHQQT